jgi:nucleoside-diphosphate-sugar epimerase
MKIAIAGAFGFIGQHLIQHLLEATDWDIVALSRSSRASEEERVQCVAVDLYSLSGASAALAGCDAAIYLVHSMAPSSRMSQGSFRDFDFILADNFGKAAVANGIKQIVYVGGMIPGCAQLSLHLQSRLEVEDVLRAHSIPVTALRCGIVIGQNASSFSIIVRLTERLPFMILPQWMRTLSNPIYVTDLVRLIRAALQNPGRDHRIIDAGMDQLVSYKDIVLATAKLMGKSPKLIDVPYISPHLSKLWVRLVSGAPKALVYPLIDSVRHEMLKDPKRPIPGTWGITPANLEEAIRKTFETPFEFRMPRLLSAIKELSEVRSIQRMPLPAKKSAVCVANRYFAWLPFFLRPFLKVVKTDGACEYRLRALNVMLLRLTMDKEKSTADHQVFRVTGGALVAAGNKGTFEFRASHDRRFVIAALHNFRPALPWSIYCFTQALVHWVVMDRFGKSLEREYD